MALVHTATNLRNTMRIERNDIPTKRRDWYVQELRRLRTLDQHVCETMRKGRERSERRTAIACAVANCVKRIAQWDATFSRLNVATEFPARPDLQRVIKERARTLQRAPHETAVVR